MSQAEVVPNSPRPHAETNDTSGYDGASRLVLLDPVARGIHASLTALNAQLGEHAISIPDGVTNGDLVLAMRDTSVLRARLARTRGAAFPAQGNPAVAYYLKEIVRLSDTSAHARRAFLPGYDALAADVIRLTVVSSCRDPQGLALAVAYEPGNVEIALEVIANAAASRDTISTLVQRWVSAGTTAPDEKRLAVARAVIDARPRDAEILNAVTDGCMDMVIHYDLRDVEAAYEAARAAVLSQVTAYRPSLDQIENSLQRTREHLSKLRANPSERARREAIGLEMSAEAMTELLKERALAERLPTLLEDSRAGKRLTRREVRALRRAGMLQ